jgi:prolyl-tRNA editing enzyme YbaK/EbsC (Cys-tRNA(Pro) deacylase)
VSCASPRKAGRAALQAELLPRPPDLDEADVIKSLVFSADGQPVLVVAGLGSKVRASARGRAGQQSRGAAPPQAARDAAAGPRPPRPCF